MKVRLVAYRKATASSTIESTYELDLQASQYVNIDKARTTKNVQNDSVPADLGNYAQVTNVYGQPDISVVGATIDAFKFVKLYDQQTVTRGSSAGSILVMHDLDPLNITVEQ